MSDERRVLGQRSKTLAEAAPHSHPILGCHLEKVDAIGNGRRQGVKERAAEAEACAANGAIVLNS